MKGMKTLRRALAFVSLIVTFGTGVFILVAGLIGMFTGQSAEIRIEDNMWIILIGVSLLTSVSIAVYGSPDRKRDSTQAMTNQETS